VQVKGGADLYFTRNSVVRGSFDALQIGALVQITRATTEGVMGPQASSVQVAEQVSAAAGKRSAAPGRGSFGEPAVTL